MIKVPIWKETTQRIAIAFVDNTSFIPKWYTKDHGFANKLCEAKGGKKQKIK